MTRLVVMVLAGCLTRTISAAYGARPTTQEAWETCRDKIFASCPGCYGASGDAARGPHPENMWPYAGAAHTRRAGIASTAV